MPAKSRQSHKEDTQRLLDQFAEHFELGAVEGKRIVPDKSGTEREIDAKGISEQGEHSSSSRDAGIGSRV